MSDEEKNACEVNSLNEEMKNFLTLTYLLGILISFVSPLAVWLIKKNSFSKEVISELSKFFNFELVVAIFMAVLSFVPLLGPFVSGILGFINIIICVFAAIQIKSGKDVHFPLQVEIIKLS